jgi:photosystem II stability/assembly factor-like uncharacterized protein
MKSLLRLSVILLTSVLSLLVNTSYSQWREKHNGNGDNTDITGISFVTPSTGFIGFTDFVGFSSDSGKTYATRNITPGNTDFNGYSINLTFGFAVKGVHAFSADSLLAYGHYGTEPSILFSRDGGLTWKIVFHRDYNMNATVSNEGITDIKFPGNGPVGFAVHNEEVLKTSDRGQTWHTIASAPNAELKKLSFPSPSVGFVSGKDKIYKTTDAGITWIPAPLPNTQSGVSYDNIFFTSNVSGYVLDNGYNKIYKTNDGSATWTKMNDGIRGNDLYFINDSTGFVAAGYYTIEKTSDNGKTWEPCKRDNDYHYLGYGFNRLYFLNNQVGWCGGDGEYLEITTDGAKETYPRAYFRIDTTGLYSTNIVNLVNSSRKNYTYKWYKNNTLISSSYNASYTHNFSEQADTIKLIVFNGVDADTAIAYQYFKVIPSPAITSFFPMVGSTGTRVEISGSNLSNVTGVSFGSTAASSFQIISDTIIDAVVANGTSGSVTVSSSYGSSSSGGFIYNPPPTSAAPAIAGFSPTSGLVGTVVTINGSNFNSDPQKNLILFGSAKAVVKSASSTQIVCTVPTGTMYQPISVLNMATHLSGSSSKPFNVIFVDSATVTPSSFTRSYYNNLPFLAESLCVNAGDIDGDGKVDLLASILHVDSIQVFRNISNIDTINFESGKDICPIPDFQRGYVTVEDFDGDGKPDFVNSTNASFVTITRNTSTPGHISVDKSFNAPVGGGSEMVSVGDLDNDGRPDIACVDYDSFLSILRNTSSIGNISFAQSLDFSTAGRAWGVAIGDIDGDGKNDVAISTNNAADFSIFRNLSTKGNIVFAPRIDISNTGIASAANQIFLMDFDGDNKLDVVMPLSGNYCVFRNISTPGNIAFAPQVNYIGGSDQGNSIGNLKGSGNPDFIAGHGSSFSVFANKSTSGNINAGYSTNFSSDYLEASVCADFNGDGKQDIAASSYNTTNKYLSVYKNNVGVPIPFSMCPNTSVQIFSDITDGTTSYRWQQDSGKGFADIYDNVNFQATNSESLTFYHVPASWNGRKYRCIVDGIRVSSTFQLNIYNHSTAVITITQDTVICQGSGSHTFTAIKSQDHSKVNAYRWQVNGKQIASTSTKTLTTNFSFKDKDTLVVILDVTMCSSPAIDTSKPLVIRVFQTPSKPGAITGPTQITVGGSNEYYIDPVTDVNTYTWTGPQSASSLPQTTVEPQVNVVWSSSFQNADAICVTATNGCGTSEASCTNSITLPVTLYSFNAEQEKAVNKLEWITAMELNLSHFEIQRSGDGIRFNEIGSVTAKNLPGSYDFYDNMPLNGANYYRLKVMDKDGKFAYSEIKKLSNATQLKVNIVPNPTVNNTLSISIINDENTVADLLVISADSKVLLKQKLNIVNGLVSHEVNISNLAGGVYFLEIATDKNKIVKQFVKIK